MLSLRQIGAAAAAAVRGASRRSLSTVEVGAANRLVTDCDVLRDTVEGWQLPYTPGPLTEAELATLHRDGFLIKDGMVDMETLDGAISAVEEVVDRLAGDLHRAGKISDRCEDAGFFQRLTLLEKQFPHASVLLHKRGQLLPGMQQLWSHPALLDAAEQVLGPDLAGHPVWNLRTKTPQQEEATVPWHQDIAYLDESCWTTLQLTAWIPLLDANFENGCMQVVRGGHRTGRAARHTCCVGGTWYVDLAEEEMTRVLECDLAKDVVTCEVPKGSALLLNNLIPHRSLNNMSDNIRWSFDLRWQRPSEPEGFYGIKPVLPMRLNGDKNYKIQWEGWAEVDRTNMQIDSLRGSAKDMVDEVKAEDKVDEEFDTTIVGPWMNKWELVNHNRHTATLPSSGLDMDTVTKA